MPKCCCSSVVEHAIGNGEVVSSILINSTIILAIQNFLLKVPFIYSFLGLKSCFLIKDRLLWLDR